MSHSPCTPPLAPSPRWRTKPQPVFTKNFPSLVWNRSWIPLNLNQLFRSLIFSVWLFIVSLELIWKAAPILLFAAFISLDCFQVAAYFALVESVNGEIWFGWNHLWTVLLLSLAIDFVLDCFSLPWIISGKPLVELFVDSFLPVWTILLGRFWKVFVPRRLFWNWNNWLLASFPRNKLSLNQNRI